MLAPNPATAAARLSPSLPVNKFGLLRPFRADLARDFARGVGDDLLASRVGQVIGSNGEFPWRPGLSANLDKVRNVKNDEALGEFARVYVSRALSLYLPQVLAVDVSAERSARLLLLTVTCTRATDANLHPPRTFTARAALPA